MTALSSFKILRIRPLLRQNGGLGGVDAAICKCGDCGKESRLSRGEGLSDSSEGLELACLGCGATCRISTEEVWALWGEQLRRDRILALSGIDPKSLYSL